MNGCSPDVPRESGQPAAQLAQITETGEFTQVSGGCGIRTHGDAVNATAVFKTAAIGH